MGLASGLITTSAHGARGPRTGDAVASRPAGRTTTGIVARPAQLTPTAPSSFHHEHSRDPPTSARSRSRPRVAPVKRALNTIARVPLAGPGPTSGDGPLSPLRPFWPALASCWPCAARVQNQRCDGHARRPHVQRQSDVSRRSVRSIRRPGGHRARHDRRGNDALTRFGTRPRSGELVGSGVGTRTSRPPDYGRVPGRTAVNSGLDDTAPVETRAATGSEPREKAASSARTIRRRSRGFPRGVRVRQGTP